MIFDYSDGKFTHQNLFPNFLLKDLKVGAVRVLVRAVTSDQSQVNDMALDFELFLKRTTENQKAFEYKLSHILEKFNKPFEDCDEVDLSTLTVVKDKGQLRNKTFRRRDFGKSRLPRYLNTDVTKNTDSGLGISCSTTLSSLKNHKYNSHGISKHDMLLDECKSDISTIEDNATNEDCKPDVTVLEVLQNSIQFSDEPSDAETISSESDSSLSDDESSFENNTQENEEGSGACGLNQNSSASSVVNNANKPSRFYPLEKKLSYNVDSLKIVNWVKQMKVKTNEEAKDHVLKLEDACDQTCQSKPIISTSIKCGKDVGQNEKTEKSHKSNKLEVDSHDESCTEVTPTKDTDIILISDSDDGATVINDTNSSSDDIFSDQPPVGKMTQKAQNFYEGVRNNGHNTILEDQEQSVQSTPKQHQPNSIKHLFYQMKSASVNKNNHHVTSKCKISEDHMDNTRITTDFISNIDKNNNSPIKQTSLCGKKTSTSALTAQKLFMLEKYLKSTETASPLQYFEQTNLTQSCQNVDYKDVESSLSVWTNNDSNNSSCLADSEPSDTESTMLKEELGETCTASIKTTGKIKHKVMSCENMCYINDSVYSDVADRTLTTVSQENNIQVRGNSTTVDFISSTPKHLNCKSVHFNGKSPSEMFSKLKLQSPSHYSYKSEGIEKCKIGLQSGVSPSSVFQKLQISSSNSKINKFASISAQGNKPSRTEQIIKTYQPAVRKIVNNINKQTQPKKKLDFSNQGPLVCSTPVKYVKTDNNIFNISSVSHISPVGKENQLQNPSITKLDNLQLGEVSNDYVVSCQKSSSQSVSEESHTISSFISKTGVKETTTITRINKKKSSKSTNINNDFEIIDEKNTSIFSKSPACKVKPRYKNILQVKSKVVNQPKKVEVNKSEAVSKSNKKTGDASPCITQNKNINHNSNSSEKSKQFSYSQFMQLHGKNEPKQVKKAFKKAEMIDSSVTATSPRSDVYELSSSPESDKSTQDNLEVTLVNKNVTTLKILSAKNSLFSSSKSECSSSNSVKLSQQNLKFSTQTVTEPSSSESRAFTFVKNIKLQRPKFNFSAPSQSKSGTEPSSSDSHTFTPVRSLKLPKPKMMTSQSCEKPLRKQVLEQRHNSKKRKLCELSDAQCSDPHSNKRAHISHPSNSDSVCTISDDSLNVTICLGQDNCNKTFCFSCQ